MKVEIDGERYKAEVYTEWELRKGYPKYDVRIKIFRYILLLKRL